MVRARLSNSGVRAEVIHVCVVELVFMFIRGASVGVELEPLACARLGFLS